jgi:hypothetical protein
MKKTAVFLLVVGLLQMAGDLVGWRVLKGLGAATAASPAPKVFSAVGGLETYSTQFFIEWTDRAGVERSIRLTPALYAHIRGPYPRRNVYGAALAYGPVLAKDLRDPVMHYALCGQAPLLRELGIDPTTVAGAVRVRYAPRPGTKLSNRPLVLEAPCP